MIVDFDEKFDNLQDEKIESSGYTLKDFFDDDSVIFNIQENREFFRDIPISELDDILDGLFQLILELTQLKLMKKCENNEKEFYNLVPSNTKAKHFKKRTRKATLKIKDDLKIIKEYTHMLINKFGGSKEDFYPNNYFLNNSIPNEIKQIIKTNIKLIDDLENKKFNIIKEYQYYPYVNDNKEKIASYLKNIRIQYQLKGVSKIEKKLVDSLFN